MTAKQRHTNRAVPSESDIRLQTHDGRLHWRLRRIGEGVVIERAQRVGAPETITCWALLRSQEAFLGCAQRDRLRFDDPHAYVQLQREFQHALAQPCPDSEPTRPAEPIGHHHDPGIGGGNRATRRFRPLRPAGRFVPNHASLWGARKRLRPRRP